ncbi:AI-2E family transporter [Arthrobacter sp. I2-34]|uniref:AI-2E family transporter n=1 Tax=Arthrobacter hankyongi TaxID=2904801 RepID=A0ABS9LC28_9MICC|nr:AI-2E family transporter [Arthrobacter hankyongi]MCG2624007.1 AI-2E family transporter [Arthrobacter hankyongi]
MVSKLGRIAASIPRAQPRPRFTLPPEAEPREEQTVGPVPDPTGIRTEPGTGSARHPIYFGFMATVGVGLALLVYFILSNVGQLLGWIAAAMFIALGLDPVVRWLGRKGLPRPAGVVAVVVVFGVLLMGFIAVLIPTIVTQTTQIVANVPRYTTDFLNSAFFQSIDRQFQVRARIEEEVAKFLANSEAVTGIFGGVLGVGSAVANGAFGALIVLVLTLYFLSSLPALKIWAYRLAPRSRRQRVQVLAEEITDSVGSYVIGQACVAVINATVAFIAMTIAQVPFTALLTFLVGLLAFIPLVGGMIAGIMVSLVALTVGWQTAVLFAVLYFAYLQIEAYFVSPRIMQRAVAVPGAVAVIAVIAGGSLMGVLGALMAIPAAAAVMLLLKEVFITRQDKN